MKAFVTTSFGPPEVLVHQEVSKPKPKANELLIQVKASSVNAADCNLRGQTYIPSGLGFLAKLMLGFKSPKIKLQGSVFAGEVVDVGKQTKEFKFGDNVFGTGPQLGAYGQYVCRPETGAITHIPENISFEEAASVPYGALTALYFLKDSAKISENQKVLIKGASGGVGVYAVQLARHFGAEVTGVCSTANIDLVKSLGAQEVIDYTKEDFTNRAEKWDIILDVVVKTTSYNKYKKSLSDNGMYLAAAGGLGDMLSMVKTKIWGNKKAVFGGGESCETRANIDLLADLLSNGKIKAVMGKSFSFEDLRAAHRYVEQGIKQGNIVVTNY